MHRSGRRLEGPLYLGTRRRSHAESEGGYLTGHAFDTVFMEHNVSDHKDDVKQFTDEAQHATDPEVRALAASATPVLREHLNLAEETQAMVKK